MAGEVFKGCAFIITDGIRDPTRQLVVSAIHKGGGLIAGQDSALLSRTASPCSWFEIQGHGKECSKNYDDTTWQLVLDRPRVSTNPQVVSTHWVHSSLATGRRLDPATHPILKPLQCSRPLPSFQQKKFCISTYKGAEKKLLMNLCNVVGAKCFAELTRSVTHLLCPFAGGSKYEVASSWGVACVTKEWLFDCIEANECIPTENYYPPPPDPSVVVPSQGVVRRQESQSLHTRQARASASDGEAVIDPPGNTTSANPCSRLASAEVQEPERRLLQQTEAVSREDIGSCFVPLMRRKRHRSSQDTQGQPTPSPSSDPAGVPAARLTTGMPASARDPEAYARPGTEKKETLNCTSTGKVMEESSRVVAAIENIMAKTAQKAAPATPSGTCTAASSAGITPKAEGLPFFPAFGSAANLTSFLPGSSRVLTALDDGMKADGDDVFSPSQAQSQAIGYQDESYKQRQFVQLVKEKLRQKKLGAAATS